MTNEQLLEKVKIGLGVPIASTAQNGTLTQKFLAVKSFMKGAGVSDAMLETDLGIDTIRIGVTDIWNLEAGEIKFSPVFHSFITSLEAESILLTASCNPADGATNIALDVKPVLIFSHRLKTYSVQLYVYDHTDQEVFIDLKLDVTEKVLTIEPGANLSAATKYAIVVSAVSVKGPQLERTVFSFTTI